MQIQVYMIRFSVTQKFASTGGRFTPRLETLSGYLAEMPSPYWVTLPVLYKSVLN